MKIHIFALRWKDEIKRSSQLRTLLKLVVIPPPWETQGHLTVGCAQGNKEFEPCLGGVRQH